MVSCFWLLASGFWLPPLSFVLLSASGCLCYLHPLESMKPEFVEPCRTVPKCSRDHVHIIFVHGMDPFDCANLAGVRDYVQQLGFHKTYYGQLYHSHHFESELRRIHEEDPDARFVLIGFSFGANMARDLAQSAKKNGITIDLLVYLGGNTLKNVPRDRPENVGRVINILANGRIWNGDTLEQAENIQVPDVWHFGSPTHPYTLEVLARELAMVASAVPFVEPIQPPVRPREESAPTPRPVTEQKPAPRDEWDFLKPVSRLGGSVTSTAAQPSASPTRSAALGP